MATETDTQTASAMSKRAQLNKEKRVDQNRTRVPEGQMTGGSANLAFDNGMSSGSNKGEDERKGKENDLQKSGAVNNEEGSGGVMNFRQVMAKEKKRQKKKSAKSQKNSGLNQGSKKAMQMAWQSLIPSWLTSIFVIDILAFMHLVLPKFFCALGEEWESPMTAVAGKKTGSNAKSAMMKSVEPMIVIVINIIVLGIIAVILVTLALLVEAITDPIGFVGTLMGQLWESIKSAFGG